MQIGNKRSELSDDSALYNHESDKLTDREKMKSLKGRKKWIQFRDYYLGKILLTLAVLVFVGMFIKTVLTPKPTDIMFLAICECNVPTEVSNLIEADFGKYMNIDPETEQVTVDSSYFFKADPYNTNMKFTTYIAAGTIGAVIMPESLYEQMGPTQRFYELDEILSPETFEELKELIIYTEQVDQKGEIIEGSAVPVGIRLSGYRYEGSIECAEPLVLCIGAGWKNLESAASFIEFLFK